MVLSQDEKGAKTGYLRSGDLAIGLPLSRQMALTVPREVRYRRHPVPRRYRRDCFAHGSSYQLTCRLSRTSWRA